MKSTLNEAIWNERFVVKLGQLRPAMPIKDVIAWSAKTYVDASDLEPEEAAEIFSHAALPNDVGAPGD